jgi:hypothetical protein
VVVSISVECPTMTLACRLMMVLFLVGCAPGKDEPVQAQDTQTVDVADTPKSVDFSPGPIPKRKTGAEAIAFTDATDALGLPPLPTQGVALVDYNGDGWPDVTLATAMGVYLFTNPGDGSFALANAAAGLSETPITRAMAPVYADVDGDADLDLLITTNGDGERLFVNQGDGTFVDESAAAGFNAHTFAFGGAFADLDGDGDLDLFVAGGIAQLTQYPGAGEPVVPEDGEHRHLMERKLGFRGTPNRVWENDGSGHFVDITEKSGLAGESGDETFGAALFDVDGDGDVDALVARDYLAPQLFLNNGKGQFLPAPAGHLPAKGTNSLMGMDVGDFDGNGLLDVYGTRFDADLLLASDPDPTKPFSTNRYPLLLTNQPDPSRIITGWGCALVDLDNDVDVDLMATSTFDYQSPDQTGPVRPGAMMVLKNTGLGYVVGGLVDVTEQVIAPADRVVHGWGLAIGDYDRDGDVDVLVAVEDIVWSQYGPLTTGYERRDTSMLLRNDSGTAQANGSLVLELRQPKTPNVFAVGARLDVTVGKTSAIRFVFAGSAYLATHSYGQHFGLGGAAAASSVKVRWPDGKVDDLGCLAAGHHVIERGTPPAACD